MKLKDPENMFFNDMNDEIKEKWMAKLQTHPSSGWDSTITYCGWREVPSVYLICKNDQVIPAQLQLQMAQLAGSEIKECEAGHMAILSAPERVVEVVKAAVDSL
jgi:pimeloyl-ACP methyl ester carboxylesterase